MHHEAALTNKLIVPLKLNKLHIQIDRNTRTHTPIHTEQTNKQNQKIMQCYMWQQPYVTTGSNHEIRFLDELTIMAYVEIVDVL